MRVCVCLCMPIYICVYIIFIRSTPPPPPTPLPFPSSYQLEADITGHKDLVDAITTRATEHGVAGNFRIEAIRTTTQALVKSYDGLHALVQKRRRALEVS